MKQFFLILAIIVSCSVMSSAQDIGTAPTAPPQGADVKAAATAASAEHYYYHNHTLVSCSCTQWKDQTENVKLANGTIVTNKGEVATHHWTKITKLKEGECVDQNGQIVDHQKLHADMASKK